MSSSSARMSMKARLSTDSPAGQLLARPGRTSRGRLSLLFAVLPFKIIMGRPANAAGQQKDFTASFMHHTGGRFAVGIIGLIIVIAGLALVVEGARRKFMKHLRTGEMSAQTRKMVKRLGTVG